MTRIANLSARVIEALIALAFVLVLGTLAALWWRHRRTMGEERVRRTLDSLTTVVARQRDSLAALGERYRVDTVRVRETTTVYRSARARIDTVLVTRGGDSIRVDTLRVVQDLSRACTATIAARDAALSTCEARVAALRRLYVADSARAVLARVSLQQAADRRVHRATRRGIVLGAAGAVAAALGLRAIAH